MHFVAIKNLRMQAVHSIYDNLLGEIFLNIQMFSVNFFSKK